MTSVPTELGTVRVHPLDARANVLHTEGLIDCKLNKKKRIITYFSLEIESFFRGIFVRTFSRTRRNCYNDHWPKSRSFCNTYFHLNHSVSSDSFVNEVRLPKVFYLSLIFIYGSLVRCYLLSHLGLN